MWLAMLGKGAKVAIAEAVCRKPAWALGSASALKSSLKPRAAKLVESALPPASVWTMAAKELVEADLEDEDSLLDAADRAKPVVVADDCDYGGSSAKRKACKNCTCGRAEGDVPEPDAPKPKPKAVATSACGNCYLGDAFRCATCPSLGLPAFKPGEKVELSLTDDI